MYREGEEELFPFPVMAAHLLYTIGWGFIITQGFFLELYPGLFNG